MFTTKSRSFNGFLFRNLYVNFPIFGKLGMPKSNQTFSRRVYLTNSAQRKDNLNTLLCFNPNNKDLHINNKDFLFSFPPH